MIIARRENDQTARTTLRIHGLILAGLMTFVGIQFLRPEETFVTQQIYAEMARTASENTWGALLFVVGSLRILAILYGFAQGQLATPPAYASSFMAGISCAIWGKIAVLFYLVNPIGWSCLCATALALLDASTCIMVARIAATTSRSVLVNGDRRAT